MRDRCQGFHKKPKPRSAWKVKRKRLPEDFPTENPGDLVVLDSIVEFIGPNFKKLYFVCCTDIATRIAFAMGNRIMRLHESLDMRPPAAVYFSLFYTSRNHPEVHLKLWNRTLN